MKPKWPLYPGALTTTHLHKFEPLNYSVLARSFEMELVDQQTLAEGFSKPNFAVAPPSDLLIIFLRTSAYIDRVRDILEELQRLTRFDVESRPKLWMILARLILDRYTDPDEAMLLIEEVFQELGMPPDMMPFTLYGELDSAGSVAATASSNAVVARLKSFLAQRLS